MEWLVVATCYFHCREISATTNIDVGKGTWEVMRHDIRNACPDVKLKKTGVTEKLYIRTEQQFTTMMRTLDVPAVRMVPRSNNPKEIIVKITFDNKDTQNATKNANTKNAKKPKKTNEKMFLLTYNTKFERLSTSVVGALCQQVIFQPLG